MESGSEAGSESEVQLESDAIEQTDVDADDGLNFPPVEEPAQTAEPIWSQTVTTLRKVAAEAGKSGSAELQCEGVSLVVESDPTLGYTYRITDARSNVLQQGVATNAKAVVDSIRALRP
jgi:hypothetical protein